MFNELQIRGQAIRDDWCEVEPTYCWFCLTASQLARSRANSQFLSINKHIVALVHKHYTINEI